MSISCFIQLVVVAVVLGLIGYYVEPYLWFTQAPTASVFAYGLIFGCVIGGLGVALRSSCSTSVCTAGRRRGSGSTDTNETETLYVGNLPFKFKDQDLQELFSDRCTVVSARVVTIGRNGRSKGYGFIDIDCGSTKAALQFDGTDVGGRKIRVSIAKEKSSKDR
jgi:hypothetical protein